MPAVVLPDPELPSAPAFSKPVTDGRMEIVIGDDRRVIVNADVDGPALARVLKVLGPVDDPGTVELSRLPVDGRHGHAEGHARPLLQVQEALGRDPHAGDLYVFGVVKVIF